MVPGAGNALGRAERGLGDAGSRAVVISPICGSACAALALIRAATRALGLIRLSPGSSERCWAQSLGGCGAGGSARKGAPCLYQAGKCSGPHRAAPVPRPEAVRAPRARGSSPGRPPRLGFLEKVAPPAGPRSNPASDSPKTTYPAPPTHGTSTSSRQGGDDQGGCGQGSPWQLLGSSVSKQQLRFGEGAQCCPATTVLAWAQRCSLLQVHDHLAGPHARRLLPLHRPQPHGSPAAAPDRGAGGL